MEQREVLPIWHLSMAAEAAPVSQGTLAGAEMVKGSLGVHDADSLFIGVPGLSRVNALLPVGQQVTLQAQPLASVLRAACRSAHYARPGGDVFCQAGRRRTCSSREHEEFALQAQAGMQ